MGPRVRLEIGSTLGPLFHVYGLDGATRVDVCATVPATLWVALTKGVSLEVAIDAAISSRARTHHIAGYEVCSRLGSATTPRPNVHSHGTWGTIGTAVAVAKLGGLDAGGVRSVINLSASMSPANTWTTALEGVTIRNAYPGRSGLEGILAVDLHRAGFTGLPDAPSDVTWATLSSCARNRVEAHSRGTVRA